MLLFFCHCSLQPSGSIKQIKELELAKLPKSRLAVALKNTLIIVEATLFWTREKGKQKLMVITM
jgi:hypothetical protein